MAIHKLSALKVERAKKPGRYGDGGGLWLHVAATGAKSWVLRYMIDGRAREMGLGSLALVSLEQAREAAAEARKKAKAGDDPIEARKLDKATRRARKAKVVLFREQAAELMASKGQKWKNPKHRQQWENTLATYAYPILGELPVAEINVDLVVRALEPIWLSKPETADRLRGRIERILSAAIALGRREGPNPAQWKGNLEHLLPERGDAEEKHHAALPWEQIPAFMAALRMREGTAARCLEFAILTGVRTSEVLGAQWSEIDEAKREWNIPAERMKKKVAHAVPLSDRALAVLKSLDRDGTGNIFPGGKAGKPLSTAALSSVIKRMNEVPEGQPAPWVDPKRAGHPITAHGFRSTLTDWAHERTAFPEAVIDEALAHKLKDKVRRSYKRGDLFEKRAKLMQSWAGYCSSPAPAGNVTPIRGAA